MWRRLWILFIARNKEFYRDKSSLGWNFVFPFLVILGFGFIFSDDDQTLYKVGVLHLKSNASIKTSQFKEFEQTKFIEFVEFESQAIGLDRLKHHRIDLLLNLQANKYWVSQSSPKGYIVEKLLHARTAPSTNSFTKESIKGREVPYVEWLLPGILGLNMMFSALFGVGYTVVRYRKNGVLKRMSVTPVKPYEFLTAQVISRMYIQLVTTTIVFVGCALIINFKPQGSIINLLIMFAIGGFCLISLGLVVAARISSEEFAGGILNLLTWPMMFLSEVWFSLEGAHPYVQTFSKLFPLTHFIDGTRQIMNDGAGLFQIRYQIISLVIMSFVFLLTGSLLFKWQN